MRTRRAPFGRVRAGDRICFKLSGGGFIGAAIAARVREFSNMRPAGLKVLEQRFAARVAAPESYWRRRRGARYAVFIWLAGWRSGIAHAPCVRRQYGSAWLLYK